MDVSGSTQGAGTVVTAGEVPQHKVVYGRHADTRKRPVRSGYSVANPLALKPFSFLKFSTGRAYKNGLSRYGIGCDGRKNHRHSRRYYCPGDWHGRARDE